MRCRNTINMILGGIGGFVLGIMTMGIAEVASWIHAGLLVLATGELFTLLLLAELADRAAEK